jgi:2-oxoisovalerate dehydrogenase E1 component
LALAGLLPIPEIQFRKYADPAYEQMHDLGTIRWRTAGTFAAPVVVRMPVGYSKKVGDPWHSVTDEASFAHSLGWRIAFPSNAADAVGLLRSALRGQDPTVFFEHRALLDSSVGRRPDPGPEYTLPFGQAARLTEGDRLTLVTWGAMVPEALAATEAFDGQVELLDLRTIIPWDSQSVLDSVRKTGRCLVVHEDIGTVGFGAEIIATLAQQAFMWLDAPLTRLSAPDSLVPYSKRLMDQVVPNKAKIQAAIEELLAF